MLRAWGRGDESALSRLIPVVHGELRRRAHRYMARERPGHTLQTGDLINEVYLRLVGSRKMTWQNRAQFYALSARLMRQILVDHARSRNSLRRGGGAAHVPFDEAAIVAKDPGPVLVPLDEALRALAAVDERKSQVVELRFFGGLGVAEIARLIGVSPRTVIRDLRFAKGWLHREMGRGAPESSASP